MEQNFEIETDWITPAENLAPEIKFTEAQLSMRCGTDVATYILDTTAQTTTGRITVSTYPLACWFAANWWRLLWETEFQMGTAWEMAHHMPAAGCGYVWPDLKFQSDTDRIEIESTASKSTGREIIRYLSSFTTSIPIKNFERSILDFISLNIERLNSSGVTDTDLHQLWKELTQERNNAKKARWRKFEAMSGFAPGDLDETTFKITNDFEKTAGKTATQEAAAYCQGTDPTLIIKSLIEQGRHAQIVARFPTIKIKIPANLAPWETGQELANQARQYLNLGQTPINIRRLADVVGISTKDLKKNKNLKTDTSIAIKKTTNEFSLALTKSGTTSHRFKIARMFGESLLRSNPDTWLLSATTKTKRQKTQRAFATEFLCPIQALREHIQDSPTCNNIKSAATIFNISPIAVASHLTHHGLLTYDQFQAYCMQEIV
jgi:hypothetical protein